MSVLLNLAKFHIKECLWWEKYATYKYTIYWDPHILDKIIWSCEIAGMGREGDGGGG